jgi:Domain of unknown function (DUF4270)
MTINNFLKKERIFLLLSSFLALISLVGCQKEPNINFGSTYVSDNNSANIIRVDTSTIIMSTAYLDSTSTVGSGYNLVGDFNDPYFGNINTRAFLQLAPPSNLPTITNFDTYDSIGMVMIFKKGNPFYGDTTYLQTFDINQVDTLYQLPSYQHAYSSKFSFPIDPTALGSTSIKILPSIPYSTQSAGDTVRIPLDHDFGEMIYNMIYNRSDSVIKEVNWLNWFHGLCISSPNVPAGTVGNVYGFRDSVIMRIYYHAPAPLVQESFIDFTLVTKGTQFNNIVVNRVGSPMENLAVPTQNTQPPPLTRSDTTGFGHSAYLSSILGLNVKLTFPNVSNIANLPDYIGLLRAELTVRPLPASYTTTWRIPPQVTVSQTDQSNIVEGPISGPTGLQNGNLVQSTLQPSATAYTYDITTFIKAQLLNIGPTVNQFGIMLNVPSPNTYTGFQRLVIPDQTYPVNQRITLSLYYISLYPHN